MKKKVPLTSSPRRSVRCHSAWQIHLHTLAKVLRKISSTLHPVNKGERKSKSMLVLLSIFIRRKQLRAQVGGERENTLEKKAQKVHAKKRRNIVRVTGSERNGLRRKQRERRRGKSEK